MAAPVVAGSTTASNQSGGTVTGTKPSGAVTGDMLLVFHTCEWNAASLMTAPSGWTLVGTADAGTNKAHMKVWKADGAVASLAFGAPSDGSSALVVLRITGADAVQTTVFSSAFGAASASSQAVPGLTPSSSTDLLLMALGIEQDGTATTVTNPSGSTAVTNVSDTGPFAKTQVASLTLSSSAATGTKTFTTSRAVSSWGGVQVAVRPPAAGGDTTAPTVPTGVTATATAYNNVNVSWTASTDAVGVAGYQVKRNGSVVGTTSTASFSDTTTLPFTSYTYTVNAVDAASNRSADSGGASVTTPHLPAGTVLNRPTQPGVVWYGNVMTGLSAYAHPGALVVAGNTNYNSPEMVSAAAGGATVLLYLDTLINDVFGRYAGLLLNSSAYGPAVPHWPGDYVVHTVGASGNPDYLNDFRVGSILLSKLESVLELMVAENPHMGGFFADDLGSRSFFPDLNWTSFPDKADYYNGAVAVAQVFRTVATRHGLVFMVNGSWNASDGGGYPSVAQHGLSLADGGCIEHHDGQISFFGPYSESGQWATASPLTNGQPFNFAIMSTSAGLTEFDGHVAFTALQTSSQYDSGVAPWSTTAFHETGLPSHTTSTTLNKTKIWNVTLLSAKVGATSVSKMYVGATQVFP